MSRRSCRSRRTSSLVSTTVTSFDSSRDRWYAAVRPTCPAPSITIFMGAVLYGNGDRFIYVDGPNSGTSVRIPPSERIQAATAAARLAAGQACPAALAQSAGPPGQTAVNQPSLPGGTRVFQVRFGPEKASSHAGQWPNNLRLTGGGTVEVTADKVRISDARNAAAETERTFAMADIANVGFSGEDMIVALRTRSDQREVLVWLSSPEEARALLELLPRTTTAEFLERKRQHERFRENLKVIAPRAPPVTPAIVGVNVALFLIMLAFGAGLTAPDSRV